MTARPSLAGVADLSDRDTAAAEAGRYLDDQVLRWFWVSTEVHPTGQRAELLSRRRDVDAAALHGRSSE